MTRLRGALRDLQYEASHDGSTPGSVSVSMTENESVTDKQSDMLAVHGDATSIKSQSRVSSVMNGSYKSPEPLGRPAHRRRLAMGKPKTVIEYVRRGARVVGEEVEIPSLKQIGLPEYDFITSEEMDEEKVKERIAESKKRKRVNIKA